MSKRTLALLGLGLGALSLIILALCPQRAGALNNGLARTPPMGWNSWNKFHCTVTEAIVKGNADAIVSSGLAAAGYVFVTTDDCWSATTRDASGNLQANTTTFPGGMPALGNYIHSKGLKFGIYASVGTSTCTGHTPGSMDHENQDVATFASWGVDYIKADRCNVPTGTDLPTLFGRWPAAIAASGRAIVLSASDNGGVQDPWAWGPITAHQWRTTGDISDSYTSMLSRMDGNAAFPGATAPGGFNDPDMLEVGNGGMTDTEYRSHFGMWALFSAPLIAGNDVRSISSANVAILTHNEVLAIDQDPLGYQAIKVSDNGAGLQVWSKPIGGSGARAVGLLNRSAAAATISVTWSSIGLSAGTATVRDVWARLDRGTFTNSYSVSVPSHGIALLKIVGTDPTVVSGFVGDMTWTYQTNGYGPAERNQSNNGTPAGDGHVLTLNGATFTKGIGAHAPSSIELRPNGNCSRFTASVGVDDEVGSNGNVTFQVLADGNVIYDSGIMTGATGTKSIDVSLVGKRDLRLMLTGGSDTKNSDHGDWANAQLTCGSGPQAIEAEAAGNTLGGTAVAAACATCSGGFKVRFLGNGPANFVTVNNINALTTGTYQLTIQYLLSGTRDFFVSINGAPGTPVTLTGTSWSVPATSTIPVVLTAGANNIRFYNDTAFAPDLDKITVQ